jgi:preprotein translocase subunit SecE
MLSLISSNQTGKLSVGLWAFPYFRSKMGRLHSRKKSPAKKKKQQTNTGGTVQTGAVDNAGTVSASASSEVGGQKRQPLPLAKKPPVEAKPDGFMSKARQFWREVVAELKKVTWPSRKQTVGSTVVVVIIVMSISLFLGLADAMLSAMIHLVLG